MQGGLYTLLKKDNYFKHKKTKRMKGFLIIALLFVSAVAQAKPSKKSSHKGGKYIKGIGFSILSDFGAGRYYADYTQAYLGSGPVDTFSGRRNHVTANILSVGLNNHFILKEMGKEKSVSINFYPKFGFTHSLGYFGTLCIPVGINYNMGNVSTYAARKESGLTLGLGIEYIRQGLLKVAKFEKDLNGEPHDGYDKRLRNIIQPYATLGVRYFTRGSHAQEVNVKYGTLPASTYDKLGKMPAAENKTGSTFWFSFSMISYIRY
jgi:hypothetical protein